MIWPLQVPHAIIAIFAVLCPCWMALMHLEAMKDLASVIAHSPMSNRLPIITILVISHRHLGAIVFIVLAASNAFCLWQVRAEPKGSARLANVETKVCFLTGAVLLLWATAVYFAVRLPFIIPLINEIQ